MPEITELTTLITNVGFPIVIALYYMVYFKKSQDSNTKAITENTEVLRNLKEIILNQRGKNE